MNSEWQYGIKYESAQDNQAELERMKALRDKALAGNARFRILVPYSGKTNDIDTSLQWYCPYCLSVLIKHDTEDLLMCHGRSGCGTDMCDFEFENKDLRIKNRTFWLFGRRYPLNPLEAHLSKMNIIKNKITDSVNDIATLKEEIVTQQCHLKELESDTRTIEDSMRKLCSDKC